MLVLCYGMPKSGSTLGFELVKGVLTHGGFAQENFINDQTGDESLKTPGPGKRNFIRGVGKQKLAEIMERIGPNRKIAIKTHTDFPDPLFEWFEELQAKGELQIFGSFRDPREMVLSLRDAAERAKKQGFDAFVENSEGRRVLRNVRNRILEFRKWASVKGSVRLDYDTVGFLPDEAITQIEKALKVTCDREAVKHYAFHKAATQRNKARKSRYRDELSAEENTEMLRRYGDFIRRVCEHDDQSWFDECRAEMLAHTSPEQP
jgi:hypothetical protein